MTNVNVEDLFDRNRFPRGRQLLPLCLYFPLGLLVCLLRIFIGFNAFLAACLIPRMTMLRSCVLRTMCMVLGIIVFEENVDEKREDAKVVVTNHVTVLDHLAVDLVLSCFMPNMWELPHIMNWWLGYRGTTGSRNQDSHENIKKRLREANCTMLLHPEGETTNGRVGLLKFNSWPFSLDLPVHPVVITVARPPIVNVSTSVLGSHWSSDLFWFLFTPYTQFTLRYMPVMQKTSTEDADAFAKRVQVQMAATIHVAPTNYTSSDKMEYLKRILFVRPPSQPRSSMPRPHFYSEESIELIRMAQQVKEVLPYVPLDSIKRDLVRTRNVDLTITNVLEGVVSFVPDTVPQTPVTLPVQNNESHISSSATGTSIACVDSRNGNAVKSPTPCSSKSKSSMDSATTAASNLSTAASSFGKTPEERMMSYQERKQQMIESARQRFIEKHGLKL